MKSVPRMLLLAACAVTLIGKLPDGLAQVPSQGLSRRR